MAENNICSFCKSTEETLIHLFWNCQTSRNIWNLLFIWFYDRTGIQIHVTPSQIMLGIVDYIEENMSILNLLFIITKQYLYACRCLGSTPYFDALLYRIYNCEKIEGSIAEHKGKLVTHQNKWNPLLL